MADGVKTSAQFDLLGAWIAAGCVGACPHRAEGACRLCEALRAEVEKAAAPGEVHADAA